MNRAEKKQAVDSMKGMFADASSAVVVHYRGMTVDEIYQLRTKARKDGIAIKVPKNTLAKIALGGTSFAGLQDMLKGPTAIAVSKDAVSAAKTIVAFAKNNEKLIIIGGIVGGNVLDEAGVKSLSNMPSLDESRAKIAGLLKAPATKIASLLQAPGGQVARVISAYSKKENA